MKKVLLIEDDAQYRKLLTDGLTDDEVEILTAENGDVALKILQNVADIKLIILDLIMPTMDGLTFYYHLKQTLKITKPVIILTNLTDTAYPQDTDILDFIVKSNISLEDLMKRIKSHLK